METPTISNNVYSNSTYGLTASGLFPVSDASGWDGREYDKKEAHELIQRGLLRIPAAPQSTPVKEEPMPATDSVRIVKVYIADPNTNLPLDKRILYTGEEKLTDLTDQELFFEVPIKELLDAHNVTRLKTVDKKASEKFGRDVYLEAVRIRDLKMVVTTVAQF